MDLGGLGFFPIADQSSLSTTTLTATFSLRTFAGGDNRGVENHLDCLPTLFVVQAFPADNTITLAAGLDGMDRPGVLSGEGVG